MHKKHFKTGIRIDSRVCTGMFCYIDVYCYNHRIGIQYFVIRVHNFLLPVTFGDCKSLGKIQKYK